MTLLGKCDGLQEASTRHYPRAHRSKQCVTAIDIPAMAQSSVARSVTANSALSGTIATEPRSAQGSARTTSRRVARPTEVGYVSCTPPAESRSGAHYGQFHEARTLGSRRRHSEASVYCPPSMPRGDGVPQRAPRGVLACMPAGDGKPALAQRARGTVMGVNIDDQRGPCPRARLAPHDVEHEPAIGEAVEGWNWHWGIITTGSVLSRSCYCVPMFCVLMPEAAK